MLNLLLAPILGILTALIKIIVYPINKLATFILPDISEKLIEVSNYIETMFDSINWGLGVLPIPLVLTILFILSVEVARHTIFVSTYLIGLVFDIINKIKFW